MAENETPKDDEQMNDETAQNADASELDAADAVESEESQVEESQVEESEPSMDEVAADAQTQATAEIATGTADATLAEAIHLADELVKTRIEKIHEAGERSVSQAVQSMETLMGSVLDSAEAATKASATANVSTSNLVKAARKLDESSHRSAKVSTIVLSVGGAMLFISVAVFGFMAAQISRQSTELEGMVLAVGKRVVDLNVGIEQFGQINDSLDQLRLTQEAFRDAQIEMTSRMNELNSALQIVQTELPSQTAESVGRQSEAFTSRVNDVETQIQSQLKVTQDLANSVQGLAGQVGSLRNQLASVNELNADVEALITLQRERYLELLQAQARSSQVEEQAEEVIIQYPNPEAPLPLPETGTN